MKLIDTPFQELFVIEPKIFGDHRGYFFESYNKKKFDSLELCYNFVQDNESLSKYGTLRGLHFQIGEFAQAKLVRVLKGNVLDVVVDLRKESATYGKHFSIQLSDENKKMLMIPRGFAHGFIVLSDEALFSYKCDNFYEPSKEGGLAFDDENLNIDWIVPREKIILAEKDKNNPKLADL